MAPLDMPNLFIPGPAGMVLIPNKIFSGENGTDVSTGHVSQIVPGQVFQTQGTGEFRVDHIGVRGCMAAEVIVGEPGAARAIMQLTSALGDSRDTVQLSLDAQNRPVLTIAYNGGSMSEASGPDGPALAAGSVVQVRAAWDSEAPLASGRHTSFNLFNSDAVPGNMGGIPNEPWPLVPMGYVLVGYGADMSDFNGTILNLQIGDQRV